MALPSALSGPWNPLRITGTPMPPNLLLMCKIIAVAILATEHFRILPDPFLPFIDGIDRLVPPEVFRRTLRTAAVMSAVLLLCNRGVRLSALVLGSCLLLGVVSSKAYYGNNKTFCGLALVLAGLSDFDRPAYLLRWQLSLVYFGAALNKLLDPDWQSGLFFEHWAGTKLKNPVYLAASSALPTLLAGKLVCWGTLLAEFAAAIGLLLPRLVPWALVVNTLFQVGLLEFTGTTFTLFFYGMQAATLAFIAWPRMLAIEADGRKLSHRLLRRLLRCFDPDGLQHWLTSAAPDRLRLNLDDGRVITGFAVIQRLLLFSPAFWLAMTLLLARTPDALSRRLLVAGVLGFFIPFQAIACHFRTRARARIEEALH